MNSINGKECTCNNPDCAKCLLINCQDDDCKVHTKEKKEAFRKRYNSQKITSISPKLKIYLDIDGVLLDTKEYRQMPYLKEFLTKVFEISNGEVYWLSTHTKHGENDIALYHLEEALDKEVFEMIKKIKNTKWYSLKTEGIDINSDFLWFDDVIFQAEYNYLESIGKEQCLLKVNNNLDEMIEYLNEL